MKLRRAWSAVLSVGRWEKRLNRIVTAVGSILCFFLSSHPCVSSCLMPPCRVSHCIFSEPQYTRASVSVPISCGIQALRNQGSLVSSLRDFQYSAGIQSQLAPFALHSLDKSLSSKMDRKASTVWKARDACPAGSAPSQ